MTRRGKAGRAEEQIVRHSCDAARSPESRQTLIQMLMLRAVAPLCMPLCCVGVADHGHGLQVKVKVTISSGAPVSFLPVTAGVVRAPRTEDEGQAVQSPSDFFSAAFDDVAEPNELPTLDPARVTAVTDRNGEATLNLGIVSGAPGLFSLSFTARDVSSAKSAVFALGERVDRVEIIQFTEGGKDVSLLDKKGGKKVRTSP